MIFKVNHQLQPILGILAFKSSLNIKFSRVGHDHKTCAKILCKDGLPCGLPCMQTLPGIKGDCR